MSSIMSSIIAGLTVACILKLMENVKRKRFIIITLVITFLVLWGQTSNVLSSVTINHSTLKQTINFKIQNNCLNLDVVNK
ncbi:hypothetical protein [Clostridium estertheticum]|uniref:hypothetical protein n=1 Tax=Clostridium estertheticum TaxID=238834 RepID=UPI001C0DF93E|nr:hypothetical protein [Clostridium estertheticum]MBU3174607.1 hypothetical protein [Clostridium estertheticum]